jgi:EmrB/QacA subfamily drug resistance transporter
MRSRQKTEKAKTMADSEQENPKHLWYGFIFLLLGILIAILDQTITDVVVPSIVVDLKIAASSATLLVTIYMVVGAAFMILMGKVVDVFGARFVLIWSMVVFAIGSLITGIAWSFGILISGRILQGLVLASMIPASLALMNVQFPSGPRRALAFALWSSIIGGAGALGPLLGGLSATLFSWRWGFYLNLPVSIIAIFGIHKFVPEVIRKESDRQFDFIGSIILVLGVASFIFGFQEGSRYGWWHPLRIPQIGKWKWPFPISISPVLIVIGLLLLVIFYLHQRSRFAVGKNVILNLRLFQIPSFLNGTLAASLMTGGLFGVMLLIPLYAQYTLGYNPLLSGLTLAPLGVGMAIGGPISAKLLRTYSARFIAIVALSIQPIALLLLVPLMSANGQGWWLAPFLILEGATWGCAYSVLVSLLLFGVSPDLSGVAGATQTAARIMAGAVGTALLSTTLTAITAKDALPIIRDIPDLTIQDQQKLKEAIQFEASLHPVVISSGETIAELRENRDYDAAIKAIQVSMVDGARVAMVVAALLSVISLFFAFRLPKTKTAPASGSDAAAAAAG